MLQAPYLYAVRLAWPSRLSVCAPSSISSPPLQVRKLAFPPAGSALTPPHALPSSFKFKDYAPKVFHHLRQRFAIDTRHYLSSLGGAYEYIEFASNSKSGSFFFYSHDGKFMIKTQSKAESKFLRRILAHYHAYVSAQPHTYITRFYGMHRIKMPHMRRAVHFVVMQSVFYGDKDVHTMYDLKGSTVGRAASAKERARGHSRCVFKDLDLMAHHDVIALGPGRREAFLLQIAEDAAFLERMGIMDYSLLLGIHRGDGPDSVPDHDHDGDGAAGGAGGDAGGAGSGTAAAAGGAAAGAGPAAGGKRPGDASESKRNDGPGGAGAGRSGDSDDDGDAASATGRSAFGGGATSSRSHAAGSHSHSRSRSLSPTHGTAGTAGTGTGTVTGMTAGSAGSRTGTGTAGPPHPGVSTPILPPAPDPRHGMGIPSATPDGKPGKDLYFMGIIDILQQYDLRKRGENLLRRVVQPGDAISAVAPDFYARRFVQFLADNSR